MSMLSPVPQFTGPKDPCRSDKSVRHLLCLSADSGKKKVAKKKGSSFQTVSALFRVRKIQVYLLAVGLSDCKMSNGDNLGLFKNSNVVSI